VIGLQTLALEQTEPDFDLIEPGGIGRQPKDLKAQPSVTRLFLLTEPSFELFGGVGGAIIKDEGHGVDLPTQGFGNDVLVHKGLEIDKAFARSAGAIDLAIGDRESGKQMAGAATLIARFVQHRLARSGWARGVLSFSCLNGGFLVEADQPRACLQEQERLDIGLEHRTSPSEEGDRIMDVLPGMIAPGAQAFRFEPATHRTGRDVRKRRVLSHTTGQFGSTPPREGDLALLGQATGAGRDLRAHLRGKNASAPHCAARQPTNAWPPIVRAICAPCDQWCH
jgi:hypothetical protein